VGRLHQPDLAGSAERRQPDEEPDEPTEEYAEMFALMSLVDPNAANRADWAKRAHDRPQGLRPEK
jgi:hypothetical protein